MIGESIGDFIEVDDASTMEGYGPFLRIRVAVNITNPLSRGLMIKLRQVADAFWIDFKYEQLSEFCFRCGRLGHIFNHCLAILELEDQGLQRHHSYGPWLRGTVPRQSGPSLIKPNFLGLVPGPSSLEWLVRPSALL
ncbi:Zinc finger, CCHC-type [Trema orientale]|uniref:Zinc finger, CCHC-type n=1 Tax=Trema orientale TaxID=63057 RepID=A0A2P5ERJ3_TREOI|nr:Zinc finger, CCHC-type [Trema orientale]